MRDQGWLVFESDAAHRPAFQPPWRSVVFARELWPILAQLDDLPESEAAGLTTIHQPIQDKGRLAAELLLDPERVDRQIVLPHELIVRSSTRPAA